MYENEKRNIDWLKVILKVVICFLIILLVVKIVSVMIGNNKEKNKKEVMQSNLNNVYENTVKKVGKEVSTYKKGIAKKYSLAELKVKEIIKDVYDEKENICDMEASYVEITRLDKEVQYKTYIKCDNIDEYDIKHVELKEDKTTNKVKTTKKKVKKTTKKVVTTKKVTTTKKTPVKTTVKTTAKTEKTYKVEFNSNGGALINDQHVKVNGKAKYVEAKRSGYKFIGWYYHDQKFDFEKPIKSNVVLVAKWAKA